MKHKKLFVSLFSFALMSLCSCSLFVGNTTPNNDNNSTETEKPNTDTKPETQPETKPDTPVTLKDFEISYDTTFKTEYFVEEVLSLKGLIVKDKTTKDVILDYVSYPFEGTILDKPNDRYEIKISKKGYNDTFIYIKVNAKVINPSKERVLDFYSINDFHGAFSNDPKNGTTGLSKIGKFLSDKKKAAPNDTFLLSCGDMWQGGVESNKTHGRIVTDAMNIIGFDAMTIGNHEFDWDEQAIIENKNLAKFPFLGANVFYADKVTLPSYLSPSYIIDKGDLQVGVIGTVQENIGSSISATIAKKFSFPNPNKYIIEEEAKLRKAGCDVVVLASHDSGFDRSGTNFSFLESVSNPTTKIDGIFLGHDHMEKTGEVNGVPYLEGYANGGSIANLKLFYEQTSNNEFVLKKKEYSTISTYNDQLFNGTYKEIDDLLIKYYSEIGNPDEVIYTFKNYQTRDALLKIACEAIEYHINSNKAKYGVEVKAGFHNTQGIRSDAQKGDFTYRDFYKVFPFDNKITYMKADKNTLNNLRTKYKTNGVESDFTFSGQYIYVGAINFISNGSAFTNVEKFNTNYNIQDAIVEYLKAHPNLY